MLEYSLEFGNKVHRLSIYPIYTLTNSFILHTFINLQYTRKYGIQVAKTVPFKGTSVGHLYLLFYILCLMPEDFSHQGQASG